MLLDLDNGARALKEFRDQFWRRLPQGGFVLSEGRYDADTGRMEGRRVHIDGSGVVREYALSLRVYTRAEMTHLLGDAGLRVVKVWGDFSGRQYEGDAPRMIFVCEKVPKRQEGFP